jgi:hypothetical protein
MDIEKLPLNSTGPSILCATLAVSGTSRSIGSEDAATSRMRPGQNFFVMRIELGEISLQKT